MTTPAVSFEFFPPRSLKAGIRLWDAAAQLAPFDPAWVSVTCGAGGTTRDATQEACEALIDRFGLRVAAHVTCTGQTVEDIAASAEALKAAGVRDVVALRGDAPEGAARWQAHPGGHADVLSLIRQLSGDFTVRVGCYPDVHPEAASAGADVDWLKAKLDAGASEAISQFFFEAETFLRFRDRCAAAGIDAARLVPGILPVADWSAARRFAEGCGARVPTETALAFDMAERHDRARLFALSHCVEMCDRLVDEGVGRLHFYTMNRPGLTRDACLALGLGQGAGRDLRRVA